MSEVLSESYPTSSPGSSSGAFVATLEQALRMQRKARLLHQQAKEAMAVATDLAARGLATPEEIRHWHAVCKDENMPHRGGLYQLVETIPLPPGTVVRRLRSEAGRYPVAPAVVYLLFLADEVIYIGVTRKPSSRMQQHKQDKDWEYVDLILCGSLTEARQLEADLIFQHQPPLNIAGRLRRDWIR